MKFLSSFIFISLFHSAVAYAELNIDITKTFETKVPIAIAPFASHTTLPEDVARIIDHDLNHSGYFDTLPLSSMLSQPNYTSRVVFKNWQLLGQEYLVIGRIQPIGNRYTVLFRLLDVSKGEQIMDYKITTKARGLRQAAHQISDLIYKKLTGIQGTFGTKVAFVSSQRKLGQMSYQLQIADIDGHNSQVIVHSKEPIMSPTWSPDGQKIAYVSFDQQRAAIFIQTLITGKRINISSFPGINGAPAWSPDGRKLALTLSKAGSPDIYVLDIATKTLKQLTRNASIDTEPVWSPDGSFLIFTSNQSGHPQLHKISRHGGQSQQLTFQGNYNTSASFSPDGSKIVMVHAQGENFKIALMNLKTGAFKVLTAGSLDESPSFSSNGAMVLYATRRNNQGVLLAVSVDGRINQQLEFQHPEVREPAWAP